MSDVREKLEAIKTISYEGRHHKKVQNCLIDCLLDILDRVEQFESDIGTMSDPTR